MVLKHPQKKQRTISVSARVYQDLRKLAPESKGIAPFVEEAINGALDDPQTRQRLVETIHRTNGN